MKWEIGPSLSHITWLMRHLYYGKSENNVAHLT